MIKVASKHGEHCSVDYVWKSQYIQNNKLDLYVIHEDEH